MKKNDIKKLCMILKEREKTEKWILKEKTISKRKKEKKRKNEESNLWLNMNSRNEKNRIKIFDLGKKQRKRKGNRIYIYK